MPSHPAKQAASLARQHLREGLVALQEIALSETGGRRNDLLEIAERAAMIMGVLFSVESERADTDETRRLGGALAGLRRLLGELQQRIGQDPRFELAAESAAAAVAALFLSQKPQPQPERAPQQQQAQAAGEAAIPLKQRAQRQAERVRLDVEVGLGTETNFYAGLSMDISMGGLFVATYTIYPVGTPITLSFELPGSKPVLAYGEVRWVRVPTSGETSPGMGIAFTQVEPEDLAGIAEFCRRRNPMYYDEEGS